MSLRIDKEILTLIERLSKKLSRRYWSEGVEDLSQDGLLLVLQLYKKKPNADKEWIFKALHNFYSAKSKKLRRYERRRVDEDKAPEPVDNTTVEEEEIDDVDLELVRQLLDQGIEKEDILKMLNMANRSLYSKLKRVRENA